MRYGLIAAAAASLLLAAPASADTITQQRAFTNISGDNAFFQFDPSFGTLNTVTVSYTVAALIGFELSDHGSYNGPVTYDVGGSFFAFGIPANAGTFLTTITQPSVGATAYFNVNYGQNLSYTGKGDLSYFIGQNKNYFSPILDRAYAGGVYPGGTIGTTRRLTVGGANSSINLNVIYDYTSNAAAVPEPATWAMMFVGVGVMGFGLRRRRKSATKTTAYTA